MRRRSLSRRDTLALAVSGSLGLALHATNGVETTQPATRPSFSIDPKLRADWLARWKKAMAGEERDRYCDRETGEELGWLVSHIECAFYYGYLATSDTAWLDRLVNWGDAWTKRAVKEPDEFVGWPKEGAASTSAVQNYITDSLLGEAMALRPLVLLAGLTKREPNLAARYEEPATRYLALAEQVFNKWDARGCWRNLKAGGGAWVVAPFGVDRTYQRWTGLYDQRKTDGFSLPPNKQHLVARWLLALYNATGRPVYRERAELWFRTMKTRIHLRNGKYYVWNYWEPAGPWDYNPDGDTKHWVGVHPNGGYYDVDLGGIVDGFEHGLVFGKPEIDRLIATNRDFMWNQNVAQAKFKRIDGEEIDARWKDSPGVLWFALLPYDAKLREIFEANHRPDSWGGLVETPMYLAMADGKC